MLRTTFADVNGEPVQVIAESWTALETLTRPPLAADRPKEGLQFPWRLARLARCTRLDIAQLLLMAQDYRALMDTVLFSVLVLYARCWKLACPLPTRVSSRRFSHP